MHITAAKKHQQLHWSSICILHKAGWCPLPWEKGSGQKSPPPPPPPPLTPNPLSHERIDKSHNDTISSLAAVNKSHIYHSVLQLSMLSPFLFLKPGRDCHWNCPPYPEDQIYARSIVCVCVCLRKGRGWEGKEGKEDLIPIIFLQNTLYDNRGSPQRAAWNNCA